jgi:hypothetical protein
MPPQQEQPTMYDALGRPLFNRGLNMGIRYGLSNYVKPWVSKLFGGGAEAAAEGAPTAGTAAAETAGESSLGSLGAADYSAAVPALSVAAPLIMAYLKYQAGSGVNEPVRKRGETACAIRALQSMAGGGENKTQAIFILNMDYRLNIFKSPKEMPPKWTREDILLMNCITLLTVIVQALGIRKRGDWETRG